jgi:hypothetical protein
MAVSLRTSVTPITTGPAGIYHFTTQIVFELFIVGIGITIQHHYPRLESTAFLIYSGAPIISPLIYSIRQNQGLIMSSGTFLALTDAEILPRADCSKGRWEDV